MYCDGTVGTKCKRVSVSKRYLPMYLPHAHAHALLHGHGHVGVVWTRQKRAETQRTMAEQVLAGEAMIFGRRKARDDKSRWRCGAEG